MSGDARPGWRSVVLDTTDARALAEFYRQLLGYEYQAGDEIPPAGRDDPNGRSWLMLRPGAGGPMLAFQQVEELPASTWPGTDVPQQLHLDFTVTSTDALAVQHARALDLGARLLLDQSDDPDEPIYVYADPDGTPSASSSTRPEQRQRAVTRCPKAGGYRRSLSPDRAAGALLTLATRGSAVEGHPGRSGRRRWMVGAGRGIRSGHIPGQALRLPFEAGSPGVSERPAPVSLEHERA